MADQTSKDSPCTCVSMIIKLDPNLLQRRESLFASSEAQSIIEQMTGVSGNGQVILKKSTKSEPEEPAEKATTDEAPSSAEGTEESNRVTENKKAKPSKAKPKNSIADVASKVMNTNKLYTNDRTARAVNKWRAFREKGEKNGLADEAGREQNGAQDEEDQKTEEEQSNDKTTDSAPSNLPTSAPKTPTHANAVEANIEDDKETDDDSDSDSDNDTKSTNKPRVASPTPPISPVLNRPARARFGRRYSMPLNALPTTCAPQPSPAGSPQHGTPRASRDSSPLSAHRPHLTAAITHLQNNREKLSTLFDKRSAMISTLDRGNEVTGAGGERKVTRLCRRRASDSTATLSDFLQQQQIKLNGDGTGRLLQRRGSVCTTAFRNRQTPSQSPRGAPILNNHRPELKSRSCEDVAAQNRRAQPHPPWPYTGGRRGSICVGQIARARDESLPGAKSPQKPGDREASLGPICSVKKTLQDKTTDETRGTNNDSVNKKPPEQGPSHQYMDRRRGSVSTAHIARTREMMQERQALANSDPKKNELSKSLPLTVANIKTHNSLLSPYSLQLYNERISSSSAGLTKTGDSTKSAEIVDKSSAPDGADQARRSWEKREPKREEAVGGKEAGSSPRRASTPAVLMPDSTNQQSYSLFLRTESEIKDDVEREIQERVARRRRELLAVRCVSAKGAQRLEARALAQSAAGRLKRNLQEVTKQRKTKELMQIEEERNRLFKQMLLLS